MKHVIISLLLACWAVAGFSSPCYYQLRVYHVSQAQLPGLEQYLVGSLHKAGIEKVGVFTPITDTGTLYVLIPFKSLDAWLKLKLDQDTIQHYLRMESILMRAFPDMPAPAVPNLQAPKNDRVYELRSYESATEALHANKVQMFNEGGEVALFHRLGFNAVFYADVLSGGHMPNLMYMTTFNSKADRDQHWAAFSNDPVWKKLVAAPEYQHNVSKADITFLRPEACSDF